LGRALRGAEARIGRAEREARLLLNRNPMRQTWRLFFVAGTIALAAACRKSPADHIKSGDDFTAQKKYNEAIVEYRAALQADEKLGEVRLKLGDIYADQGDVANAYREYVRASDLLPDSRDAQLKGGSMLLFANRFAEAKTRAEQVLKKNPHDSTALMLLGNALAGLKDINGAFQRLNDAIEAEPSASAYSNLGSLQMSRGDRRLAEASFKKAINADPNSVPARVALANYYRVQNREFEAETMLKEAVRIEPLNVQANGNLVELYIRTQRAAEAEQPLKAIVQVMNNADARFALAEYYLRMKRTEEATAILRKLVESNDHAALARARLASVDYAGGRTAAAHAALDDLLRTNPNDRPALLLKGQLLASDKKLDEALRFLKRAADSDPSRDAEPNVIAARIYIAQARLDDALEMYKKVLSRTPAFIPGQLGLAQLYAARGDFRASVELARGAVTNDPRNAEARLILVRALQGAGDDAAAERELRILQDRMPNSAAVEVQVGALFLSRNNQAAARAAFTKALELGPGSPEALLGLIGVDLTSNNRAAAVQRIEERLKATPNDKNVWYLAANTYLSLRDFANAERALRKTIELDPSNLNAFAMLGGVYAAQGRLDDARTEFDAWIVQQPRSVSAHTMMAMLLEKQNKPLEAKKAYEKILEIDPHAAIAANNLAFHHATHGGNLDVAMQLAQTAKSQVPGEPEFNDTLGYIYLKQNVTDQAIVYFQQAIGGNQLNPQFHYHLGLAYAQQGEDSKAIAAFKQALAFNRPFEGMDDAKKQLSDLVIH
jgi:tetratricopeptide (TPR) repeat protein